MRQGERRHGSEEKRASSPHPKMSTLLRLEICFLLCIHLLDLFSVNRLLRLELGRREAGGGRLTRSCFLTTIPRLRERGVRDLARRFEIAFFSWSSCAG